MSISNVVGTAKTNKLWCSYCEKKIAQGARVMFVLDDEELRPMKDVFHDECADAAGIEEDYMHPYEDGNF